MIIRTTSSMNASEVLILEKIDNPFQIGTDFRIDLLEIRHVCVLCQAGASLQDDLCCQAGSNPGQLLAMFEGTAASLFCPFVQHPATAGSQMVSKKIVKDS